MQASTKTSNFIYSFFLILLQPYAMIWWMMMADQKKMLRFWGMPKMPTLFASVTQIRVDGNQKGGMLPPSRLVTSLQLPARIQRPRNLEYFGMLEVGNGRHLADTKQSKQQAIVCGGWCLISKCSITHAVI